MCHLTLMVAMLANFTAYNHHHEKFINLSNCQIKYSHRNIPLALPPPSLQTRHKR